MGFTMEGHAHLVEHWGKMLRGEDTTLPIGPDNMRQLLRKMFPVRRQI